MLYRIIQIARYLWAAPCSAVGLVLAFPGLLLGGGSASLVNGVIEVSLAGFLRRIGHSRLPFRAVTFGHVIIGTSRSSLRRLRPHESVHVRQYEVWGASFFIAYPLSSLLQILRGRNPYWHNWFEMQAYASQGGAMPRSSAEEHKPT